MKIVNNEVVEFRTLHKIDSTGKSRSWTVKVRLVKRLPMAPPQYDWDINIETVLKINKELINGEVDIPAGSYAQLWTESGVDNGKIMRSIATYVRNGKNIGKSNETTALQQAVLEASSLWRRRKISGFDQSLISQNRRYYPMAAFDADKKTLKFPAFLQMKYDGDRCMTTMENGDVVLYSRQTKNITGFDYIKEALLDAFKASANDGYDIALDGELYKHGLSLQKITGIVKNAVKESRLQYIIFDVLVKNKLDMKLSDRMKLLDDVFKRIKNPHIIKAPTFVVNNEKEMEEMTENFIRDNYEGSMWKDPDGLYRTSVHGEVRSSSILKNKPLYSDEFEVIGFKQGEKGKDVGAIIWVLKTKPRPLNNGKIVEGREFTSVPKDMTLDERNELYNDAKQNFENKYNGRMMTVEYQRLSDNGVPLRAKAVAFRD